MEPEGAEVPTEQPSPLIVVVDDDQDILDIQRFILAQRGYRVACFKDSLEALEAMAENPPHLVITDLMMESLDAGFSFAQRIKENPALAHVPIIIITGVESQRGFDFAPRTPEDLAAMHADAFIAKPIDADVLLRNVEKLLASSGS